jgi:2-oxoglutarate dehydrogenase E1 component
VPLPDSLLTGDNAAFLDDQYATWLRDPSAVAPAFRELFASFGNPPAHNGVVPGETPVFPHRSIFGGTSAGPGDGLSGRVTALVFMHRIHGHRWAEINPLGPRIRGDVPELDPAYHGIGAAELDREVGNPGVAGVPARTTVRALLEHVRRAWTGSIGCEISDLREFSQRRWVREQIELVPVDPSLDRPTAERFLRKLADAENFERIIQTRFPGAKRFSLEGAETLVPLLDLLIRTCAAHGASDFVLGMAHRGRLNALVNVLNKPVRLVVDEFQDVKGAAHGSGDVKYHMGFSSDTTTQDGKPVHLTLSPNPSHLEAVDPVVEGRARAKQERFGDEGRKRVVPLLIHGDAAFAGQGIVPEVLNLSELSGYRTGGTLHVVVNNQIGFTTPPSDARSTPYCTDVARMLGVPIFHVNGEDPGALAAVARIAAEWRMRFQRDVIIDLYCYRKHGHNVADEPTFTQPHMYEKIRARSTPRDTAALGLERLGLLTKDDAARIDRESNADLVAEAEAEAAYEPPAIHPEGVKLLRDLWSRYTGSLADSVDTGFPRDRLVEIMTRLNTLPDGAWHPKIRRLVQQRLEMSTGERPLDWGTGEQAAFATLLADGYRVRLSGQDSARGTFTQRHAILTDTATEQEYAPLRQLGRFDIHDSALSEFGVLGFEYGYALDSPDTLVAWEAQFGDFVNGAQVIVDQYLVSAEQKWGRQNHLVLLLPHGFEGQGPEHSSGRLERFLSACAEDNLQVAVPSTPASYFHLLRRQLLRPVRKPLVVMTPKALLRHPAATSSLDDLATGRFEVLLPDPRPPARIDRVIFCAGKVYYDLDAARGDAPVALHRLEQIHPFPQAEIAAILAESPDAAVVWCQEEPKNMGAWPSLLGWWLDALPGAPLPRYVGRPPAAAVATGSYKKHGAEQAELVREALS